MSIAVVWRLMQIGCREPHVSLSIMWSSSTHRLGVSTRQFRIHRVLATCENCLLSDLLLCPYDPWYTVHFRLLCCRTRNKHSQIAIRGLGTSTISPYLPHQHSRGFR